MAAHDPDDPHHIAVAMIANALIANTGSRKTAAYEAAERSELDDTPCGRVFWRQVRNLLRSGQYIPPHRGHFPEFPTGREVHYERVPMKVTKWPTT